MDQIDFNNKVNYIKNNGIQGKNGTYSYVSSLLNANEISNGLLLKVKLEDIEYVAKILVSNKSKQERFIDEMNFQSKSEGPYIVKSLDIGTTQLSDNSKKEYLFYIMDEYVPFSSIFNKISEHQKLKYILQICDGLKYCHKMNVIHRDLKPENILYDKQNDKVLISDFGIAHFENSNKTSQSEKIGNFRYHAPEQNIIGFKDYGPFTDIYSLGLIINELFTKEISLGTKYKRIRDVYPLYSFLDEIIDTMLVNDYHLREHDINVIINKIKIGNNNVDKFEEEVITKINNELIEKNIKLSNDSIEIIKNDFALVDYFIKNKINPTDKKLNWNYHYNFTYNLNNIYLDTYLLLKIYNFVNYKFQYECNGSYIDNYTFDLEKDKYLINQFQEVLDSYNVHPYFKHYKNESMNLFKRLKDYHAKEILRDINREIEKDKEYVLNAPLFCIYANTFELISEFLNYNNDVYILDFVSFNVTNFSNDLIENEPYLTSRNYVLKFLNNIKETYKSITILDNENFTINKLDKESLLNSINLKINNLSYVRNGDALDFINSEKYIDEDISKFTLYDYQLSSISYCLNLNLNEILNIDFE